MYAVYLNIYILLEVYEWFVSVRTDLTEDGAWSRLLVAHATSKDSGNYSCVLDGVVTASISVHVLTGTRGHL